MIKTLFKFTVWSVSLSATVAGFMIYENPTLRDQVEAMGVVLPSFLQAELASPAEARDAVFADIHDHSNDSVSGTSLSVAGVIATGRSAQVCEIIDSYPRQSTSDLSFRSGVVSRICQPFIRYRRAELDRCGDSHSDPYLSKFTWPSRNEMAKRGKANIYTDAAYQAQLPKLLNRVNELRAAATDLCCAPGDLQCRRGMAQVSVSVCKPKSDPNQPDPCVFGGTFRMAGSGYDSIFRAISRQRGSGAAAELRAIAEQNLTGVRKLASTSEGPQSGSITLTSYISEGGSTAQMEPVILHELGHACSMVKMQNASLDGSTPEAMTKALRATKWLDSAKRRCDPNYRIPEAVDDFWESIGESRELSSCLKDIATLNQKNQIDKPCNGLCAGHYVEESVGIAFSLLLGNLTGGPDGVFPNTCDHVRDGQHPMVSDVADCLMQHSPRFRARMRNAYGCSTGNSVAAMGGSGTPGILKTSSRN